MNINRILDYPIISKNLYETIRNAFDTVFGKSSNMLDEPLAPIMLATGYNGTEMAINVDFYKSSREMLIISFANIALNCREFTYNTLQYSFLNSKIVMYLKSFVDNEELELLVKDICTEVFCEENIIDTLKKSENLLVLENALNQNFVEREPEKFSNIETFKEFIGDTEFIFFVKSIRLDGLNCLYGIPVASSLINYDLLGVFNIKYVSDTLEDYLTEEDFKSIYNLHNKLKDSLISTLDIKNQIKINFEEDVVFAMSFLNSLKLKEDING